MSFLILKCFNVRFYLVIDAAESFSKKTGAGFIQPFIGGAVGVAVLTGPQFVLSQEAFFGQYFEVDKRDYPQRRKGFYMANGTRLPGTTAGFASR